MRFPFIRREDRISELYEARIADLKEGFDNERKQIMRLVEALAYQIEYHRAEAGRAQPVLPRAHQLVDTPTGARMQSMPYMSEEEEDLRAMEDAGLIDAAELEAQLAQLGIEVEQDD